MKNHGFKDRRIIRNRKTKNHNSELELEGIGNIQRPRMDCQPRGRTNWCTWYCPKMNGEVQKTGRAWKCHSKKVIVHFFQIDFTLISTIFMI